MPIPETMLDVHTHDGSGYMPLIDYGAWRVALLRYSDQLVPSKRDTMQRHTETDEVFVLLAGQCVLFLGEGNEHISDIHALDLEPLKLYNVKKGCWHTPTLSPDAAVLIVENRDTTEPNSPRIALDLGQRERIVQLANALWRT